MSFLSNRNGLSVGVSPYVTLGGPLALYKFAPSLLLDFTNTETLDPRITFTRASSGTFTGSNGLIQSAAINAPRFDYNPVTLASNGLLIEEQRTNLVTYSEQFDTVAWGKVGTASVTANSATAPDGTTTADTLNLPAYADRINPLPATTVAGNTTYTASVWLSGTGTIELSLANANGTYVITTTEITLTSVLTRYQVTHTTSATTTSLFLILGRYNGTGTATSAVVWGAQLEAGAFATSYIPTVAAQVTRSADVAVMTGTNFSSWYNQAEGTFYAEVVYNGQLIGSAAQTNAISIDDGTSNSFAIRTVRDPSAPQADVTVSSGGVNQMDSLGFVPVIVGTRYKRVLAYALNNAIPCVNGVLDGATDTLFTVPVGANRFTLPSTSCALYIRKIAYYPQRLPNAQLQALTV